MLENRGKFWKKISETFRRKFGNNISHQKLLETGYHFLDFRLSLLQFYEVHKQRHRYNKYLFEKFSFSRWIPELPPTHAQSNIFKNKINISNS